MEDENTILDSLEIVSSANGSRFVIVKSRVAFRKLPTHTPTKSERLMEKNRNGEFGSMQVLIWILISFSIRVV